jgi:Putative auto-transporter adhesin, head GIN domain
MLPLHRLLAPVPALGVAIVLVASAAWIPVTAQAFGSLALASAQVTGSGVVTEQTRPVGTFSKLRLDGAITVEARPAASASVSVRGDDNIVPLVTAEVQGETLVLSTQSGASFRTRLPIVVTVNFVQLKGAELRGSGDLNISQIQGERFDAAVSGSGDLRIAQAQVGVLNASVAGSGDLRAKGQAGEVRFNVAGSGDIHAAELVAQRGSVNVAGSGDARVHAKESLSVNVVGSGDVWVSGQPAQLRKNVIGSGDVHSLP